MSNLLIILSHTSIIAIHC